MCLQVRCHLIKCAWALSSLSEWEHPLLPLVISLLSRPSAPPSEPASATNPLTSSNAASTATAAHQVDLDSERSADPRALAVSTSFSGDGVPASTGSWKAIWHLPKEAVTQLAQVILLASAAGRSELTAGIPDELRQTCSRTWRRELSRALHPNSLPAAVILWNHLFPRARRIHLSICRFEFLCYVQALAWGPAAEHWYLPVTLLERVPEMLIAFTCGA
jgi:hypothetical protein